MQPINDPTVGAVYFWLAPCCGLVKIGFTARSVWRRAAEVRYRWPFESCRPELLELIGAMPGTRRTEDAVHGRFRRLRVRGRVSARTDWFRDDDMLRDFVLAACGPHDPLLILPGEPLGADGRFHGTSTARLLFIDKEAA